METTKKIYVAPQVESLTVELEEGIVQTSPGAGVSSTPSAKMWDTGDAGVSNGDGDGAF